MMLCSPNSPQVLLLVQGTGSGKSVVTLNVGCVDCGVILIIEEFLSLAANKNLKLIKQKITTDRRASVSVRLY